MYKINSSQVPTFNYLVWAGLQSRTFLTWCTVQVLVKQSRRTKNDCYASFYVQTPKDTRLSNIQPTTNSLTFVWEVPTVHSNELHLFWVRHSNSLVLMRCRPKIRTYHLPDDERMHYVLSYSCGLQWHSVFKLKP